MPTVKKKAAETNPPTSRADLIGNTFWKNRTRHGVKKIFETPEIMWEAACEYFEWANNNPWYEVKFLGPQLEQKLIPTARPLTMVHLCLHLGVSQSYFRKFKSLLPEDETEFRDVIERIENTVYVQKFEGAAVGAFNPMIIARDLGLKEKTELANPEGETFRTTTSHEVIFKKFGEKQSDDNQPDGQ